MVASKKRTVKAKAAKAEKRPARRTTLGLGEIDCMKLEINDSSLCLKSRCRGHCKVRIHISCRPRFAEIECYWDGRQWVCSEAHAE